MYYLYVSSSLNLPSLTEYIVFKDNVTHYGFIRNLNYVSNCVNSQPKYPKTVDSVIAQNKEYVSDFNLKLLASAKTIPKLDKKLKQNHPELYL